MRCRVPVIILALLLLPTATPAWAQNGLTAGALNLKSTFDNIGIRAAFTGDANANATATVQFRKVGDVTFKNAFTPVIDHRATINGTANPGANEGRLSIVGLTPGTMYEVVWTWSDPDSVTGTNPRSGTISTLSSTALTISESWVSMTDGTCGGHAPCFSTIPAAITAAVAGTKIRVMPGSYPPLTISKSGSAGAGYIAIVGENRDTTFITGGSSVTSNITMAASASYVQVKNFRLKPTAHNSVVVGANAHHLWFENLYHEDVHGAGTCTSGDYDDAGFFFSDGTHEIFVINNTILGTWLLTCTVPGTDWDQIVNGIDMYGTSAIGGFVIKGNTINGGFRDCIGDGGETWGDGFRDNSDIINNTVTNCKDDGIQMEGEDMNLRIGGNNVDANRGNSTMAMAAHLVGPVYVYRNVFYQHGNPGYCGKMYENTQGYGFFIHNTCHAINGSDGFSGGGNANGNPFDNFYNNIIVSNNICLDTFASTSKANGNLYQCGAYFQSWGGSSYGSVAAFRTGTGNEVNGKQGNPLFIDVQKHIDATSPAFNAGIIIPNFNSLDSAWPYAGVAPDIGAFEVGGALPPIPPTAPIGLILQ